MASILMKEGMDGKFGYLLSDEVVESAKSLTRRRAILFRAGSANRKSELLKI